MSADVQLAVRVASVCHRYGNTVALDGISLSIASGSTAAFIGPDGVGKSTVLGLIAGVKRIQSGTLTALGGNMASRAHRDMVAPRIAYMPQGLGRNLYPTLSVVENIDFFGRLYGQAEGERRNRIARLLTATGLDPFPDRPAGKLSGGMKQKLGLCCALIHDPDLLILDEPTTGVDPLSRRQFWDLIGRIRAERPGMTVLVATAYMEEAERFGHIVAIDEGRVIAAGDRAGILAQTKASTLEEAYIALQRPERRGDHTELTIPKLQHSDGPAAIAAENLTMHFGDFTAVDRVSFRIQRGEIFGFLGSNGCGKTTTMKMLTGLLPASEGRAELLGKPVNARDIATRMRIGYMSQAFSLYEEISVRANLELHGRLFRIPVGELEARVAATLSRFDLSSVPDALPPALPLGMRQRLQLAAACLHQPEILILDEPTSGVDPAARDRFWRLLVEMSRRDSVTIFISTHFMNEAERCDRVSLMHAGRVLSIGSPEELRLARGAHNLEDAFVAYLEEASAQAALQETKDTPLLSVMADPSNTSDISAAEIASAPQTPHRSSAASLRRIWAFARREAVEVLRDRIRLAFALLGPLVLMVTFGFGISFDIENLRYAVLDRDQSYESRLFLEQFSQSRYFIEQARLGDEFEIDRRLQSGELRFAVDIPPGFGRDLLQDRQPQVSFWLDGGNTFPAETARGYIQGAVLTYAADRYRQLNGHDRQMLPINVEPRFRYNQDFRSVFAITPGTIMLLLVLIPAMLTAVGVVREKEMGSITNVYASPATVGEYLIGKQLPYIAIGFASFVTLVLLAGGLFGVVPKGSVTALSIAALMYIFAATAFGLLISAFVSTQVAAIFATAILTVIPAAHYSGFLYPASTLDGVAWAMGIGFPAQWFQTVSLGVFAKGLGAGAFAQEIAVLFGFGVIFLVLARLAIRRQGS
ncbi:ribosome-associated ATPase/putative transporter RbbA [Sinorhizobium medicae]|uniref:Fused ribosome-associated ATPase: ATP-binding protein ATP-binding protein putative membrane protein n=1 Tax=Sinorhizobium medicae TaxID=110321 RepID=A0A508WRG9_9HYPH|nr:ribosome-associated ATPase/putative transporter RbbA [Sinorhizobium medicae]MDX0524796.1 ribosome-associated ATPase/putative transporter RbbA [Sinorhizobium medicae]VTZ59853.1 fused ribosome-associated ATPase: ATP-binding protein; ATP-binding protein; putative membrane protein [Sinorhizobium medicae]